jgi:hypothetical protein
LLAGSASGQSSNLLKNPNGEEDLQSWRVMGNASATDCLGFGKCFAISQDGFIYQDVTVSEAVTGDFAVLIGFTSTEEPNADSKHLARPYLFGYFMNSPDLPKAKILANLTGQEMAAKITAVGDWVKQYGIFKVLPGTLSIRIFLRSGCARTDASAVCASRFRRPGIFLFKSEEEARVFVDSYQ